MKSGCEYHCVTLVSQFDSDSTPFMLDSYESEYEEQCRAQNKHALELDQLRNANRNLSAQV